MNKINEIQILLEGLLQKYSVDLDALDERKRKYLGEDNMLAFLLGEQTVYEYIIDELQNIIDKIGGTENGQT